MLLLLYSSILFFFIFNIIIFVLNPVILSLYEHFKHKPYLVIDLIKLEQTSSEPFLCYKLYFHIKGLNLWYFFLNCQNAFLLRFYVVISCVTSSITLNIYQTEYYEVIRMCMFINHIQYMWNSEHSLYMLASQYLVTFNIL